MFGRGAQDTPLRARHEREGRETRNRQELGASLGERAGAFKPRRDRNRLAVDRAATTRREGDVATECREEAQ